MLAFAACGPSTPSPSAAQGPGISRPAPPPTTLAAAIRKAVHLGPAGEAVTVSLSFGLKVRDPARLARLIASGQTVSPQTYASEFGPDPTAARSAVARLRELGLTAALSPGSGLIATAGPAPRPSALVEVA